MQVKEQLSALFDSELFGVQQDFLFEELLINSSFQQELRHYQIMRDVLQSTYANKLLTKKCLS